MGSEGKSPVDKASPSTRQRVLRACERCRMKKSRCDGASPCGRCRAYNQTCVLRSHQKPSNKVYPKGYVEMLELEQTMLVAGLQELYRRCVSGEGWTGQSVEALPNGMPLVHDILSRLGTLKQEVKESPTKIDTDLDTFLQTLLSTNGLSYNFKILPDANREFNGQLNDPYSSTRFPTSRQDSMNSIDSLDSTNSTDSMDSIGSLQGQETVDAFVPVVSTNTAYCEPFIDFYANQQSQISPQQPQAGVVHQLSWQIDGIDLCNYMDFAMEGQVSTCLPTYPDHIAGTLPLSSSTWTC